MCIRDRFQDGAVLRARRSIKALLDVRPDEVTVVRDGKYQVVKAASVQVGETVQILSLIHIEMCIRDRPWLRRRRR